MAQIQACVDTTVVPSLDDFLESVKYEACKKALMAVKSVLGILKAESELAQRELD